MSPAELRLQACLAEGPRSSRDVIAEMVTAGFTAKQIRRAREQLAVVVRRSGCRAAMRTFWSTPPAGQAQPLIEAHGDHASARPRARSQSQIRAAQVGAGGDDDGVEGGIQRHHDEPAAGLSEAERDRMSGRIAAFVTRGLGADEARAVAVALVVRDRGNDPALGSCIECQAFERQECPVTPRPATDVHQCWYRRAATP